MIIKHRRDIDVSVFVFKAAQVSRLYEDLEGNNVVCESDVCRRGKENLKWFNEQATQKSIV
jgi:hypothetical protein